MQMASRIRRRAAYSKRYAQRILHDVKSKINKAGMHATSSISIGITALFTVFGTSAYVMYRDYRRERRIMDTFAKGNILEPVRHDQYEVRLYPRDEEMDKMRHVFRSDLSNQYYLVFGQVGSGKTRLIMEVVRNMMLDSGRHRQGAPVYVIASQGHSFAETFAKSVDFSYDEHISFNFLLDYIFRVGQLPDRDPQSKLERLLNAIEKAAFRYLDETGKPAVLIIDGVDYIYETMPCAMKLLQEKAKLWADTHIVRMVFVSNSRRTEEMMQLNHSAWSRAGLPLIIGDLSPEESREFLLLDDPLMAKATTACRKRKNKYLKAAYDKKHNDKNDENDEEVTLIQVDATEFRMPDEYIEQIIDLVGGRIYNLLRAKNEWLKGREFSDTAKYLKLKERSKFIELTKSPERRKVLEKLYLAPKKCMLMRKLIDQTSRDDVLACAFNNVIRIEQEDKKGVMIYFESRLTEVVMDEVFSDIRSLDRISRISYAMNNFFKYLLGRK